jgi:hypothetical protein
MNMPLYRLDMETNNDAENDLYETLEYDYTEFTHCYNFLIEGYSLSSNIGFITRRRGIGNSFNEALTYAFENIGILLYSKYNICTNETMMSDYKPIDIFDRSQPIRSGFAFYPLLPEHIQSFREDEERYFMSQEDNY